MVKCKCGCGGECKPGNIWIYAHNLKDFKHSEESKKKMSEARIKLYEDPLEREKISQKLMGHVVSDKTKKKISANSKGMSDRGMSGKKHSENTKQKMSDARKGHRLGENNPNWKGGLTFSRYCSLFNEAFKKIIRDSYNNRCFICGKTKEDEGQNLAVHHVNYDKNCLCGSPCEFVPLCRSCHGKTNGNRKYWEDTIMCYLYPERYFMVD